ncbi:ribokinase [Methanobrevibacter sp. 87.7]|uniref:carbohydrate kinase family protein n=1 Tax=Methanobrevibacter sp. 87.7 TaxID=387957 RepID=UPI000B504BF4|nr:PfkB family carbohydrate kinase [Methanobrevibacter sp. 87.7]OWT33524.1 ribokinase [Methanobrevibacter sp. 87.7]
MEIADDILYDVIGFGALNVDKLFTVDEIACHDEERSILKSERSPGGSAANTIIGLANLGLTTSYIGKIANDNDGELLELNLAEHGVHLNNLIYADEGVSGAALGFVDQNGERALYINTGVNEEISLNEINPIELNRGKILHITSMFGETFETQKELCPKLPKSMIVSFDPGLIYAKLGVEAIKPILDRTDILLINENELFVLCEDYYRKRDNIPKDEKLSFRDLAIKLRDDGIKIVIVKRGTKGAYGINSDDEEVKIPAFLVDAVDTTAAGDSFNTGFLYSYVNGFSLEKSVTVGNWVASQSVQAMGIAGLPMKEDLEKFLSDYYDED